MAESTDDTHNISSLTERLKTLKIYPIFQECSEKNNLTALQFMCILDFHANYSIKLYDRISKSQQPKLLGQLLQFSQFEKFKYFHYPVNKHYGNCVLQCKYCPLVGPCGCILSHMVINHNVHTALNKCIFCEREPLDMHVANNSLPLCYINYLERNRIEIDINVCGIVGNFYDMLRKPTNENEEFALNIARKLDRIPQNKRRQLEIDIEMKILQIEMEAMEEGSQ